MTTSAPPAGGLTLEELAHRLELSVETAAELLAPFREAGIVAEHGGRLLVADRLVAAAFAPGGPAEQRAEEPLQARVTDYLERHRGNPAGRRSTRIAEGVRGDKARLRALLRDAPEFVNLGTERVQCWALASWAGEPEPEEAAA